MKCFAGRKNVFLCEVLLILAAFIKINIRQKRLI